MSFPRHWTLLPSLTNLSHVFWLVYGCKKKKTTPRVRRTRRGRILDRCDAPALFPAFSAVFPSFRNPKEGFCRVRVIRLLFANEIKKKERDRRSLDGRRPKKKKKWKSRRRGDLQRRWLKPRRRMAAFNEQWIYGRRSFSSICHNTHTYISFSLSFCLHMYMSVYIIHIYMYIYRRTRYVICSRSDSFFFNGGRRNGMTNTWECSRHYNRTRHSSCIKANNLMHTCSVVLTAFIIERMGIIDAAHRSVRFSAMPRGAFYCGAFL